MNKLFDVIKFAFAGIGVMELILYATDIGKTQVFPIEDVDVDLQQIRLGIALASFLIYLVVELLEPVTDD